MQPVHRARKTPRARATRERVLAATGALFFEKGYLATTMSDIASDAGVSVQTLYLSFGSKVEILATLHDVTLIGDDDPTPVLEREWVRQFAAEPDPGVAIDLLMSHETAMNARVARVFRVIEAASADPDVGALREEHRRQRRATYSAFAEHLVGKQGIDPGLSVRDIAETIYAAVCTEYFTVLVLDLGWTERRAGDWTGAVLRERLLPPPGPSDRGR